MNLKALARLACKILALYAFLEAIIYLQNAVPLVGGIQQRGWGDPLIITAIISALSALVILVAAGWLVWAKAEPLAARMVGRESERDSKAPAKPNSADLPATAIAILGLFIITLALPQLGSFLVTVITSIFKPEVGQNEAFSATYYGVGIIIKLGLGLWLFLGGQWFARVITRTGASKPSRTGK